MPISVLTDDLVYHDHPDAEGKVAVRCPDPDCHLGGDGGPWRSPRVQQNKAKTTIALHLSRSHGYVGASSESARHQARRRERGLARGQRSPETMGIVALTPDEQAEVLALRKENPRKWTQDRLAGRFDCSDTTIRRLLRGRREGDEPVMADVDDFVDVSAIGKMLGLSKAHAYTLVKEDGFPPSRGMRKSRGDGKGTPARLWDRSEVQAWAIAHGYEILEPSPPTVEAPAPEPSAAPVVAQEPLPAPEPTSLPSEEPTELEQFAHVLVSDIRALAVRNDELEKRAVGVEALQAEVADYKARYEDLGGRYTTLARDFRALEDRRDALQKSHDEKWRDRDKLEREVKDLRAENEQLKISENNAVVNAAKKGTALHGVMQGYLDDRDRIPGARGAVPPNGGKRYGYYSTGPEVTNPVIDRRTAEVLQKQAPRSAKEN
jgi:predicted DNA-binding transcriptional regulator AlpA